MKRKLFISCILINIFLLINYIKCSNITNIVFGDQTKGVLAAFGDFNSDELTDAFILRDDFKTLVIYTGNESEPLLTPGPKCEFKNFEITSVVPGDFDGDAFMDVLITVKKKGSDLLNLYINWGTIDDHMNCTSEDVEPLIQMRGEPLALDYNKDMIIDLFGKDEENQRAFWIFNKERNKPEKKLLPPHKHNPQLSVPHAHAYIDLNNDFVADLFITTVESFEVWYGEREGFNYSHKIDLPKGNYAQHVGQTVFLDVELKGFLNQLLPMCFDQKCINSTILVHAGNHFHDLQVNLKDNDNVQWGFVVPEPNEIYTNTISLRGGDFNMDGYPDLLATLARSSGQRQTFLLENVPCERTCGQLSRTFVVRWKALAPFTEGTVMGTFYDFYQDGVLDVIMIENIKNNYKMVAFRNSLDYDANFVKVIALTGLMNSASQMKISPFGRKKRTYGTNLPGPRIVYNTTTQDGYPQHGASAQLPQSAYFSLQLPYTIFGLGRTPNFVDSLTVGLSNRSRSWTQLIPNSQMIVVPHPIDEPWKWKAQLFVTPSKLIWMSVIALGITCLIILLIIFVLFIKEKREDQIEKKQESHRFHFDAM